MWLTKLLRRPEKPETLRLREEALRETLRLSEELVQRKLSLATADEDTALAMLRDSDEDVRIAARSRLAQIRWSQGFRKTTVAVEE